MKDQLAIVKVKVLKKHIKAGKRFCSGKCPVALALLDAGFQRVSVESYTIAATTRRGKQTTVVAKTPPSASSFIHSFYTKRAVEPFTFELTVPVSVLKKVKYAGKYKIT